MTWKQKKNTTETAQRKKTLKNLFFQQQKNATTDGTDGLRMRAVVLLLKCRFVALIPLLGSYFESQKPTPLLGCKSLLRQGEKTS